MKELSAANINARITEKLSAKRAAQDEAASLIAAALLDDCDGE